MKTILKIFMLSIFPFFTIVYSQADCEKIYFEKMNSQEVFVAWDGTQMVLEDVYGYFKISWIHKFEKKISPTEYMTLFISPNLSEIEAEIDALQSLRDSIGGEWYNFEYSGEGIDYSNVSQKKSLYEDLEARINIARDHFEKRCDVMGYILCKLEYYESNFFKDSDFDDFQDFTALRKAHAYEEFTRRDKESLVELKAEESPDEFLIQITQESLDRDSPRSEYELKKVDLSHEFYDLHKKLRDAIY